MDNKHISGLDIEQLKSQIGFGTAFKATLGFYAAQTVATLLGMAVLGTVGLIVYLFFR